MDRFYFGSKAWWAGILAAAVLFVAITGRIFIALAFIAVRGAISLIRAATSD